MFCAPGLWEVLPGFRMGSQGCKRRMWRGKSSLIKLRGEKKKRLVLGLPPFSSWLLLLIRSKADRLVLWGEFFFPSSAQKAWGTLASNFSYSTGWAGLRTRPKEPGMLRFWVLGFLGSLQQYFGVSRSNLEVFNIVWRCTL